MSAAVDTPAALTCPRCGGSPDPAGGRGHLARCASCGVLGRIEDPAGQRRLAALPAIDESFAMRAVTERLGDRGGEVRVHGAELIFAPYWRVRSVLAGVASGHRRRTRRVLERTTLENGQTVFQWEERDDGLEEVHREVQRDQLALVSACPLEELALPTLDHRRQDPGSLGVARELSSLGEIRVFEPNLRKSGTVLDPLLRRDEAEREADLLFDRQREGMASDLVGGQSESVRIGRSIYLLFYPVYIVRFQHDGRRGTAAVDAVSGRVAGLHLPRANDGAHDRRLLTLAALAGGVLPASLARIALSPPAILATADAEGFRLRLLVAALLGVGAAIAGLNHLLRRRGRRA